MNTSTTMMDESSGGNQQRTRPSSQPQQQPPTPQPQLQPQPQPQPRPQQQHQQQHLQRQQQEVREPQLLSPLQQGQQVQAQYQLQRQHQQPTKQLNEPLHHNNTNNDKNTNTNLLNYVSSSPPNLILNSSGTAETTTQQKSKEMKPPSATNATTNGRNGCHPSGSSSSPRKNHTIPATTASVQKPNEMTATTITNGMNSHHSSQQRQRQQQQPLQQISQQQLQQLQQQQLSQQQLQQLQIYQQQLQRQKNQQQQQHANIFPYRMTYGTKVSGASKPTSSSPSLFPAKLVLYNALRLFILIQCLLIVFITLHHMSTNEYYYFYHPVDNSTPAQQKSSFNARTGKYPLPSGRIASSSSVQNNNNNNNVPYDKPKITTTTFCKEEDETSKDNSKMNLFTLDHYCSRPHYDYNTAAEADDPSKKKKVYRHDQLPILIIGGSDGSGTRAFVDLLQNELGVPMIVEDKQTLDIHASTLFNRQGWPYLANYIFNYTHSGNYSVNDIPDHARNVIISELQRFKDYYDRKAKSSIFYPNNGLLSGGRNLPSRGFFGGGINRPSSLRITKHSYERSSHAPPFNSAIGVLYGFKAPISMMLLPFLLETYRHVKFIHVLRDGRDVSLSSNMSPLNKFFDTFYGNVSAAQRRLYAKQINDTVSTDRKTNSNIPDPASNILAMDLWNDWNIQVNQFCQKASAETVQAMQEESEKGKPKTTFDYIMVRTEELVSSSASTKYALMTKLASFVGSIQYPNQNICTYMKNVKIQDMGQSSKFFDHTDPRNKGPASRYAPGRFPRDPYHDRQGDLFERLGNMRMRIPPHRRLSPSSSDANDNIHSNAMMNKHLSNITDTKGLEYERSKLIDQLIGHMNPMKRRRDADENVLDDEVARSGAIDPDRYDSNYRTMLDYPQHANKEEVAVATTNKQRRLSFAPNLTPNLGRSSFTAKSTGNVLNRYGKWATILKDEVRLLKALEERGAKGLQYFGYEPYQDDIDYDLYHSDATAICPSDTNE